MLFFSSPNTGPLSRKLSFRLSVQRDRLPSSSALILRILPLGLPITTAFQSAPRPIFSSCLKSSHAAVSRRVPKVWLGMTWTSLKRQSTAVSRTVRPRRMPAVTPVEAWAPRRRVMEPPTSVATPAPTKASVCDAKMPAVTRGKDV